MAAAGTIRQAKKVARENSLSVRAHTMTREVSRMSTLVVTRPPENRPDHPDRPYPRNAGNGPNYLADRLPDRRPAGRPPTLQDLFEALQPGTAGTASRRRDLRSSVKRTALLLGDVPAAIPLDLPAIAKKLAALSPAAVGLTPKSLANIRSNFLAAVTASGFKPVHRRVRLPLLPAWKKLLTELKSN